MAKKKNKNRVAGESRTQNVMNKWREIRDISDKLTKKGYRSDRIRKFIGENYHISVDSVYFILRNVDSEAVTNPSITYTNVMRNDFNL